MKLDLFGDGSLIILSTLRHTVGHRRVPSFNTDG
jgi:hypothetical protein